MNNVISKSKKTQLLTSVYPLFAIVLLLVQLFGIYLFAMGVSPVFDRMVTVTSAVEMIFGVLYLGGSWYRGLVSAGFGLAFLGILIAMAKDLIVNIPFIKKMFSKEMNDSKVAKKIIIAYGSNVGKCYLMSLAFIMACYCVQGFRLPSNVTLLVGLWAATWLLTRIFYTVVDGYRIDSIFIKTFYDAVSTVPVIAMMFYAKSSSVNDVYYLIKGLFISPVYCLVGMIAPIIYFLILIFTMRSWFDINESIVLQTYDTRYSGQVFFGLSIALGVGSIISYVVLGYDARLDFDKIVEFFMPFLPIILLSGAIWVSSVLPFDFLVKNSEDDKNKGKYTLDERGVLTILPGVTEIQSHAFEYRKDIKVVNIPTSVEVIGVYAFAGCSELKEINCQHTEKASGWEEGWNAQCDARVYWSPEFEEVVVAPAPKPAPQPAAAPQVVVQPAVQVVVQSAPQPVPQTVPFVASQPDPVVVVQPPQAAQFVEEPAPQVVEQPAPQVAEQPAPQVAEQTAADDVVETVVVE